MTPCEGEIHVNGLARQCPKRATITRHETHEAPGRSAQRVTRHYCGDCDAEARRRPSVPKVSPVVAQGLAHAYRPPASGSMQCLDCGLAEGFDLHTHILARRHVDARPEGAPVENPRAAIEAVAVERARLEAAAAAAPARVLRLPLLERLQAARTADERDRIALEAKRAAERALVLAHEGLERAATAWRDSRKGIVLPLAAGVDIALEACESARRAQAECRELGL